MGIPLRRADGALFGTLCGIDPEAQSESITQEQDLLDLLGGLLSGLLHTEMNLVSEARRVERAEVEALSDGMTGLFNARGEADRAMYADKERSGRRRRGTAAVRT